MKSRTCLLAFTLLAMYATFVRCQLEGEPAFTAIWYNRGTPLFPFNNILNIGREFARVPLPFIDFPSGTFWNVTYDPIPVAVSDAIQSRTEHFAVQAFATCSPPADGDYQIHVQAKDGFRFTQNGVLLSEPAAWGLNGDTRPDITVSLLASEEYEWEIQFFQEVGTRFWFVRFLDGDVWRPINSTWCKPRPPPEPFHFGSERYSALDGTHPSSPLQSCQGNSNFAFSFLSHPLAVENTNVYALVTRFTFGTKCLIVRNASDEDKFVAVATKPPDLNIANRYCDMSGIHVHRRIGGYTVSNDHECKFRFLTAGDPVDNITDYAYAAGTVDSIKSFFFEAATFAVLSNASPSKRNRGPRNNYRAFKIPPGYD